MSVVVPTLDTRELTLRCVDAILTARPPQGVGLDLVVVDDGSSDGTVAALEERPSIRILRNESPTGYASAVNRGVAAARGDLVVLLNSDAEVEPGSLTRIVEAFDEDPRLGIAGAALSYPDGSPQWSAGREPGLAWLFAQASGIPALLGRLPGWRRLKPLHATRAIDVAWVPGAAMALRAEVWATHGPLDDSFGFYSQDLDLCLRVRQAGWRVRLVPQFRVVHLHGATIAANGRDVVGNADLGLLWIDLVTWAEKRKGRAFAARARAAILLGAGLRLATRRTLGTVLPADHRQEWRAETVALAAARRRLAASTSSPRS